MGTCFRGHCQYVRAVFKSYLSTWDEASANEKKDILSKMLTATDHQGQKLTEHQIICEAINLQVAGSDTTSTTLTYLIWRYALPQTFYYDLIMF